MKNLIIVILAYFLMSFGCANTNKLGNNTSADSVRLDYSFVFVNSNKGYTYDTKITVERDGILIGESKVKDQEKKNKYFIVIPKGKSDIKLTLFALYEGTWEPRLKENDYSFDCIIYQNKNFTQDESFDIVVDIKNEIIKVNGKIQ